MTRASPMPRLLTKHQAAAYCGLSSPTFCERCPVEPVALGEGERLKRWDIRALDRWIDSLAKNEDASQVDWLTKIGEQDGRGARQRAQ